MTSVHTALLNGWRAAAPLYIDKGHSVTAAPVPYWAEVPNRHVIKEPQQIRITLDIDDCMCQN